ncbi:alpha/beta hydrolase [Lentilactobacillus kosonis]|uniref:Acetyl esterase family enzyme n=1 Tax=Lentilactobacillus kosonis TaxID=2810561 RepID=A0A401FLX6_9LACO|nr:alpha/beta hydrolase [Lentilactobacillus kosonis]GAY73389.1 acetyl esterase family enzyme [Lentilactobacillus kosonis]
MKIETVALDDQKISLLDIYQSNTDEKLPGLVIIGGGSYNPIRERDSERVAVTFATQAFQTFVVKYPVGENRSYEGAKQAIAAAFNYVTAHADELQVDVDKLGIIGFSAGGQLAAAYANDHETLANYAILGYPVIKPTLDERMGVKTEDIVTLVSSTTPPTFIFGAVQDELTPFTEHILPYTNALADHHVPFELHEFASGNHGMGLGNKYTGVVNGDRVDEHFSKWFELAIDWLKQII